MRITGGKYRGRLIACPRGEIRPAMDRMRESLFAILGDLTGQAFLDLFSGSGLVGIEAASRGASPVVLVERDRGKRDVIRRNLSFVEEETHLFIMPVERFLRYTKEQFDIIYLDPPFAMPGKDSLIRRIDELNLLKAYGMVILHHPKEDVIPEEIGNLFLCDRRTYGRSILVFMRRKNED